MAATGTVNYHVHKDHRQAFEIDADGVVGNLISPELQVTEVSLLDTRGKHVAASFEKDSVGFAKVPTRVASFAEPKDWQTTYNAELKELLVSTLAVKEVVIFDHTVREDNPNSDRKPARNVHSDYSTEGAKRRLIDILGADKASKWSDGHYAFINVWRPVDNPINSAPIGFVRPSSVEPQDWILIDLIYPDRRGHIMGLAANEQHEWIYQSKMTPNEVAFFNIYDNRGRPSIGHSAIDLVEDPNINTIRKSIESRTLVRY